MEDNQEFTAENSIEKKKVKPAKEPKERLDVLLVQRGFFTSRERAKASIMAGEVFVNNQREDKAGSTFGIYSAIEVKGAKMKYVSRGGYKLEKAINSFEISLEGKTCMDVGSSTGGFTDCMLQGGAVKVFAVDVGTNQLAYKLRVDERVVSMEKTNVRYLEASTLPSLVDFVSIDVAFISLTKILENVRTFMKDGAEIVCLIKPQFEAGREKVGNKGVVKDKKVHEEVICNVLTFACSCGFELLGLEFSPIKGPEGNIEYLLYARAAEGALDKEKAEPIDGTLGEEAEPADGALGEKAELADGALGEEAEPADGALGKDAEPIDENKIKKWAADIVKKAHDELD